MESSNKCRQLKKHIRKIINKVGIKRIVLSLAIMFISILFVMSIIWFCSGMIGSGLNSGKYRKAKVTVTQTISLRESGKGSVKSEWILTYDGKTWKEKISEGESKEYAPEVSLFEFSMFDKIRKSDLERTKKGYVPKFGKEGLFFAILRTEDEDVYSNFNICFQFGWGKIRKITAKYIYNENYQVTQSYKFEY